MVGQTSGAYEVAPRKQRRKQKERLVEAVACKVRRSLLLYNFVAVKS